MLVNIFFHYTRGPASFNIFLRAFLLNVSFSDLLVLYEAVKLTFVHTVRVLLGVEPP